ncbi:MAG: Na+/H+ antiporter subunit E [Thermoplasmata archaeon]
MKTYPYAVLALAFTWMFLKGSITLLSFLEGLFFAILTVFISRTIIKPETRETIPGVLKRLPSFLLYLAFLVKSIVHGNIDVIYRVLHPKLPVYPGILKVSIEGKSELEVAMMANTITLTPGTLTMDVDMEKGVMFVHTINAKDLERVRRELKEVDGYVARVFR